MAARFILPKRLPIAAASLAGKRTPAFVRFNSSSSSSRAARIVEIAARAEKPSPLETAVPVMWAICGGLTYMAWNRIEEKTGQENVDKLLIV